jgi:F-type H+-transporting ATPase subunit delta
MNVNKQARQQARKVYALCRVDGLLNENRVRQVVGYLLKSGSRHSPAVLAHFLRLVRLDCEQHTARIESALPLAPDLQASTDISLKSAYGQGLTTVFIERPSLIAGMRIQVGNDVYDGSVLGRLAALKKSL